MGVIDPDGNAGILCRFQRIAPKWAVMRFYDAIFGM